MLQATGSLHVGRALLRVEMSISGLRPTAEKHLNPHLTSPHTNPKKFAVEGYSLCHSAYRYDCITLGISENGESLFWVLRDSILQQLSLSADLAAPGPSEGAISAYSFER